jgi:hypothetical protein
MDPMATYYQDATQNFVVLEVKPPHTAKPAEIIMWVSETLRPSVLQTFWTIAFRNPQKNDSHSMNHTHPALGDRGLHVVSSV